MERGASCDAAPSNPCDGVSGVCIAINSAIYGDNCSVPNPDVTSIVAGICDGQEYCEVTVSDSIFGIDTPGCNAELTPSYECYYNGNPWYSPPTFSWTETDTPAVLDSCGA